MRKKTVLVTGGAGFIGSHLCEELVKRGYMVVAVDNFDPMYPRPQKEANIKWLKKQKNFILVEADVRDLKMMEKVFSKYKFDHIFHLAGRGGIPQSKLDPFFYLDDIATGTLVILESAAKHGVKMIINASTSSVYAQTKGKPSKETDNVDTPGSVYTASKRAAELLCHVYHVLYGMGVVNVRFFSVYGPRGRQDMAVYLFTRLIDNQQTIENHKPKNKRDFTYVSDIVSGLIATMKLPKETYEVINLGYGKPYTMQYLRELIAKELGKKAIVGKLTPPLPSDMKITYSNSTRARKLLSWKPKVKLEEGVKKFVEWYKDNQQFTA